MKERAIRTTLVVGRCNTVVIVVLVDESLLGKGALNLMRVNFGAMKRSRLVVALISCDPTDR